MHTGRTALLSLVLLAGGARFTEAPTARAAEPCACAAPEPSWHEILPPTSLRIAAIDEGDAIVAGEIGEAPLEIGGERFAARGPADFFVTRIDARGRHLWTKAFGGPYQKVIGSIAAGEGAIVLSGLSEGGIDLGGGALGAGAFMAKLDGTGRHVWSKAIAGVGVHKVRIDGEGNIVVLLGAKGPVDLGSGPITSPGGQIVAKLDAGGRYLWSRTYGPEVEVKDVAVSRRGEVVAVGRLTGRYDFGGGTIESHGGALIVSYQRDGSFWWNQRWVGVDVHEARRVVVNGFGNVFVHIKAESGPVLGLYQYDSLGRRSWSALLGGMAVFAAGDAGDVVYGTVSYTTGEATLGMLDDRGRLLWERKLGRNGETKIDDVALTRSGAVLIAGRASGPTDLGGGVVVRPRAHSLGFVAALGPAAGAPPRRSP